MSERKIVVGKSPEYLASEGNIPSTSSEGPQASDRPPSPIPETNPREKHFPSVLLGGDYQYVPSIRIICMASQLV